MTPEKKVKTKVVAILKTFGAYYFYPVTGGYGASGVPDIVGCYKGKFFAIECKAGKVKQLRFKRRTLLRSLHRVARLSWSMRTTYRMLIS